MTTVTSKVVIRIVLLVGGVVGATLICQLRATGRQPTDPLLEQAQAAWKKRQEAVRTLRVSFTSKILTPKGALTGKMPPLPGSKATRDEVLPPKDAIHTGSGEVLLDGKKSRITQQWSVWHGGRKEFVPTDMTSTFDGKLSTFFDHSNPGHPQAVIERASKNAFGTDIMFSPLMASVRGLDSSLVSQDWNLGSYSHARKVLSGTRTLVELTRQRNETRGEGKLWVDPSQDFAIIRAEQYDRDGKLNIKITVVQSKVTSPEAVWLPERWTSAMYTLGGKLSKQVEITTQNREVNVDTSEQDFQAVLPSGTVVVDDSSTEQRLYLTRDEGKRRNILPSELSASYEELVHTDTGDLAPQKVSYWRWLLIATGILVVLTSLWLLTRHRLPWRRTCAGPGHASLS